MEELKIGEIAKATCGKLIPPLAAGSVKGVSADTRTLKKGDIFFALKGERFDAHRFVGQAAKKGVVACVVSKKVPSPVPLIKVGDTLSALQAFARYYRNLFSPLVIGITGSNGKTTTKDMLAGILSSCSGVVATKGNYNNLIGLPLTLFNLAGDTKYCVLEMGANRPGEIARLTRISLPDIGILTNIGETHLQFFRCIENVLSAKMELARSMDKNGLLIINNDDPYLSRAIKRIKQDVLTYGIRNQSDVMADDISFDPERSTCSFTLKEGRKRGTITVPTLGIYNVYNALAACSAASRLKIPLSSVAASLRHFKLSRLRLEIRDYRGAKIINDTYNANPTSVRAISMEIARIFPEQRKIFVLGDMAELGRTSADLHRDTGKMLFEEGMDIIVAVGEERGAVAGGASGAGMYGKNIFECRDKNTAVRKLKSLIKSGDVVIIKGSRRMSMEEVADKLF